MSSSLGINHLREELVGHCTLIVLSLIGFAIYSLTYSLVYASNASTSSSIGGGKNGVVIVASLEMWMVSTHIVASLLSTCIQGVGVALLRIREPLPHVASAQTSLFLGIALVTTIVGILCLNEPKKYSVSFFGAAAFPQLSCVGTFAWAWVMYVSSLGSQTWSAGGFTVGLTDFGCLGIAMTVLMTPLSIISKLRFTCDHLRGDATLKSICKNDKNILCGGIWLPLIFCVGGFVLYGCGFFMQSNIRNSTFVFLGMVLRILGIFLFLICSFIYLGSTNDSNDVFGVCSLTATCLCLASLFDNLLYKRWRALSPSGSTSYASTKVNRFNFKKNTATSMNFQNAAAHWPTLQENKDNIFRAPQMHSLGRFFTTR